MGQGGRGEVGGAVGVWGEVGRVWGAGGRGGQWGRMRGNWGGGQQGQGAWGVPGGAVGGEGSAVGWGAVDHPSGPPQPHPPPQSPAPWTGTGTGTSWCHLARAAISVPPQLSVPPPPHPPTLPPTLPGGRPAKGGAPPAPGAGRGGRGQAAAWSACHRGHRPAAGTGWPDPGDGPQGGMWGEELPNSCPTGARGGGGDRPGSGTVSAGGCGAVGDTVVPMGRWPSGCH